MALPASSWHLARPDGPFFHCALNYDFLHTGDGLRACTYAVTAAKMMGSGTSWAQSHLNVHAHAEKLIALISEESPQEQAKMTFIMWKMKTRQQHNS